MQITINLAGKKLAIDVKPTTLADHWSEEDVRRSVEHSDENEEDSEDEYEKKVREGVLRHFIIEACNEGLRQAVAACKDIPGLNFVDCSNPADDEQYQRFTLHPEDDEEHVSYTITLTQNEPERW